MKEGLETRLKVAEELNFYQAHKKPSDDIPDIEHDRNMRALASGYTQVYRQ